MTFEDLMNNLNGLKEKEVKDKFKKALEIVLEHYDSIPEEDILYALESGDFDAFLHWEGDDMFGTEGMRL